MSARPLHILHVLAETGWSGGEVQLEHVVRHLHERGHFNECALVPGAAFGRTARELGLPVHDVNLRRPLRPGGALRLRRLVRGLDPDVVHFGCGRSLLWGGLALLGVERLSKLTTRRIDYPIGRSPWRGGRYRHLVDHVVANCAAVRDRVLDAGVPAERVTLVHEGIDVEPWLGVGADRQVARARLGLPADALVVSCAATLRPRKGQRILIEAFSRLAGRFPQAVLVLAGEGSDRDALRALVERSGLSGRIRIPGAVRPVRDLYAASDVGVMASYNEGLSNACLEQAACGLPLVVTDVGGLPEIVEDGVTGSVVPAGDVSGFEDRIGLLLDDESRRRSAGEAGRRRVLERFTATRMVLQMEQLFEELVGDRPGAGPAGRSG